MHASLSSSLARSLSPLLQGPHRVLCHIETYHSIRSYKLQSLSYTLENAAARAQPIHPQNIFAIVFFVHKNYVPFLCASSSLRRSSFGFGKMAMPIVDKLCGQRRKHVKQERNKHIVDSDKICTRSISSLARWFHIIYIDWVRIFIDVVVFRSCFFFSFLLCSARLCCVAHITTPTNWECTEVFMLIWCPCSSAWHSPLSLSLAMVFYGWFTVLNE